MVRSAVAAVCLSLFVAGCGTDQPDPAAAPPAPPVAPAAETGRQEGALEGQVLNIGPPRDARDGAGKVLPLIAEVRQPEAERVRRPEGRDVKAFFGTMTVRAVEDPVRVLWSGPVTFGPGVAGLGVLPVHVDVPYDEDDPGLARLARTVPGMKAMQEHGAFGPPAEVRLERIEYADGTTESL